MGITPNYDLDVDTSLGGNSASDYVISSQKAIKTYVDNNSGGGTATDVQINGTSITSSNVANIITNSAYNASSNKIATMTDVPTVNNATLTIQKNGTTVNSFTANASSNVTANITVPTTASDVGAADTDLSNLSATGNLKLCGNIVKKDQNVISSTSLNGSSNLDKKSVLQAYLPNDNYTYLVLVCGDCDTTTTSGQYFKLSINTGLAGIVRICQARTRSNSNVMAGGGVWVPVDGTRQFDIVRSTSFNGTATVDIRAYWRVM